jgi:hypothetical protein
LGATHQSIYRFFVLKLTDVLHDVGELGSTLLVKRLVIFRGAWLVEEISCDSALTGIAMMWSKDRGEQSRYLKYLGYRRSR